MTIPEIPSTRKSHTAFDRRTFLKASLAGSALGLFPWLASEGRAQERAPKLVLLYTPHGTVFDQWRPVGSGRDFTMSPILSPLAAHRERMVIVDGVGIESGTEYYLPHTYTMPVLWTGSPIDEADSRFCRADHGKCFGWNTGVSVDQYIAANLPSTTPYRSIELGHRTGGGHPSSRMIYTGPAAPKSPLDGAATAWETLFGGSSTASDAMRRARVLDAVRGDLRSRRGRLSSSDRMRLEAHAAALDELERSLIDPTAACTRPPMPMVTDEVAIDRQSDLVAAALGCGLSNIVSLQITLADNDNSLYPWAGLNEGGHHTLSHDSNAAAQATLAGLYTWYAGRVAYLLDRLAATPDAEGSSVLDNTLVVWGSELGVAWSHDASNVPFVLAGGAAGRLDGGRYLQVAAGTQLNRLLVSMCHAMGLDSVESYGSIDRGSGGLPGLFP